MARPQASGWTWNETRVEALADRIRQDHTCGRIAVWFNEQYQEEFPGLALTKDSILKAVRSKVVINFLTALYGEEEAQSLIARIRRPRGRPKGAGDKVPRASHGGGGRTLRTRRPGKHLAVGALGYSRPR